jgi:hypothetical protein
MIVFRMDGKKYRRNSALEIVRALEQDESGYPHRGGTLWEFLMWSFDRLADRIPSREMDLSDRMDDEALALHYLCLREEYGAGELSIGCPLGGASEIMRDKIRGIIYDRTKTSENVETEGERSICDA